MDTSSKTLSILSLILTIATYLHCCYAKVVSVTKNIDGKGIIRYHYYSKSHDLGHVHGSPPSFSNNNNEEENDGANRCKISAKNVLILGVGTSMSVSDYELLSKELVLSSFNGKSYTTIPIMIDPEPEWMIKTNAIKFARLVNTIVEELEAGTLIPHQELCHNIQTKDINLTSFAIGVKNALSIYIGGHSAGGQAALGSISSLSFIPKGFFGLDPYGIDSNIDAKYFHQRPANHRQQGSNGLLRIASLNWGFTEATCGVEIDKAAKAGYQISNRSNRVLYQIINEKNSTSTLQAQAHHCIFTDNGCSFICPKSISKSQQQNILSIIGRSFKQFFQAIQSQRPFERQHFEVYNTTESPLIKLYVNQDEVLMHGSNIHKNTSDEVTK